MDYVSPTIEPLGGDDMVQIQGTWLFAINQIWAINYGAVVNAAVATNAAVVKLASVFFAAFFWKTNYIR